MEAANVLFVPGLALALGWPRSTVGAVAISLAMIASAGLLVVGALYWRGVDGRLKGLGRASLKQALAVADRAETPMLAATGLAIAASLAAVLIDGFTATSIAAALLTLLAVLEFVNYYRVQLQYFDNLADLKRLATRKLKRAHLARDLAHFRRR
jgi:NaMN:DMB phosphoribosyltransferase